MSLDSRKALDDAKALECLGLALLGGLALSLVAQVVGYLVQIQVGEQSVDGLGSHTGDELLGIAVVQGLVVLGQAVQDVEVLVLGEKLEALHVHLLGGTGLDDDVSFVVDDRFQFSWRECREGFRSCWESSGNTIYGLRAP